MLGDGAVGVECGAGVLRGCTALGIHVAIRACSYDVLHEEVNTVLARYEVAGSLHVDPFIAALVVEETADRYALDVVDNLVHRRARFNGRGVVRIARGERHADSGDYSYSKTLHAEDSRKMEGRIDKQRKLPRRTR